MQLIRTFIARPLGALPVMELTRTGPGRFAASNSLGVLDAWILYDNENEVLVYSLSEMITLDTHLAQRGSRACVCGHAKR